MGTLEVHATREEVAHQMLQCAVERFRRAEAELRHAMDDLCKAQEELRTHGVIVDVEMQPATQAAWVEYRASRRPQPR